MLALTSAEVKVLEQGRIIDKVSVSEAIRMAQMRQYVGQGTRTRVKKIWLNAEAAAAEEARRAVEMRREHPWQAGWRTTSGPALQPSMEWVTSRLTAY